ncbi:hypothetical protein BDW74DRAFT_172017 [Aspergillus multicolor]|uniref:uncharacterized protein n=1 Tax=Aspergillus multicolor TaxID=41759 RepID=UPI003CCCAB52
MELDTPMTGLDPGGVVQFIPGVCTVTEMKRYSVRPPLSFAYCGSSIGEIDYHVPYQIGKCSEYTKASLSHESVDEWMNETGPFKSTTDTQSELSGRVRWIFAGTAHTTLDADGNILTSGETLEIAMRQESFARLAERYHFTEALDAWRYRSTSGTASREVIYSENGQVESIVLTLSLRLSGSFASIIAISHTFPSNTSTALGLRVSPYDQTLLEQSLQKHSHLLGHALLIPTLLIEISLSTNLLFMQKVRQELSVVEKATGQHGWLEIPAADAPAHDNELSRLGHAAKIHVGLSWRRIEAVGVYLEVVRGVMGELEGVGAFGPAGVGGNGVRDGGIEAYRQWLGNLELALRFRLVDMKYNERRADNQITAVSSTFGNRIYGLLSQRDNMIGVSVAMESKKISEASKRDGSALKSLTVLTAIFFPATYIATLFSLPTFDTTPFWAYWVVVIPLTLLIFGSWSCWTVYRQGQIAAEAESGRRDIHRGIEVDPERAFGGAGASGSSQSQRRGKGNGNGNSRTGTGAMAFLGPTLRQIRVHAKDTEA